MADLFFTEEHRTLRQTIRQFVEREVTPHVEEWENEEYLPDSIIRRMGELGFLGLRYPEELGGSGWDFLSTLIRAEEIVASGSMGLQTAVSVHAEMATPPIEKFGTNDLKQRFVVPALKGEMIGALGITEPAAGSDVSGIETFARREGDEWIINGTKLFISNGCRANFVTTIVRTKAPGEGSKHGAFSLFVVETDRPGFKVGKKLHKIGRCSSDTAELIYDNVRIPASNLVGEEGRGFQQIMWELQGERLAAAAGCLAHAQLAWDTTVKYARERVQFGQTLSRFQVIRHTLADLAARIEAIRQFIYVTAWRFNQGDYPTTQISMCKLLAAQLACDVADYGVQVHGGYGYMHEYPISRFWRDARVGRITAGTDEIQREIIAKELKI